MIFAGIPGLGGKTLFGPRAERSGSHRCGQYLCATCSTVDGGAVEVVYSVGACAGLQAREDDWAPASQRRGD